MKIVAITGPPSVDLSILVRWLNSIHGVSVTQEGRSFSLLYDIIHRSLANPWLIDPNMAGVLRERLAEGLSHILEGVYRTISDIEKLKVWGDAHAHYIDPLDKPGFVEFYFDLFPSGGVVVVLEDPLVSIGKLMDRRWVTTSWDAADVVARHFASSERASRKYAKAVFSFSIGATSMLGADNLDQARALSAWLDLPQTTPTDDLISALVAAQEHRQSALGLDVRAAYEERLQHWRTELARQ